MSAKAKSSPSSSISPPRGAASSRDAAKTATQPVLNDETRGFVRRVIGAGLVHVDDVKKVVVSLMADDDRFSPQRLADGLVGAGVLTQWQARKLLHGKGRGFHLGSYRLLKPLGKGGMGVVFLARHQVMNRQMALKILPSEASSDPRRIERFKEEARASAQLDHKNIVQAFDFAESDGKLFIVMEYIDGIDLHRVIARDGPMSFGSALDAILQTTEGLAHAHQRGIIHRDIKPSNLLLRSDGVLKVSDMGLARIGWNDTASPENPGRLTGTADFVAPEQAINSRTVDARADIYSLGCAWYFLLTGQPPFKGDTVHARLAKHQTQPAPDVRQTRSDCPAAMAELIARMMSKQPRERPASAVELLGQLQRLAKQTPKSTLAQHPSSGATPIESYDTVSEDSGSGTIDDSGPLEEIPTAALAAVEELDFGNLPAIDLSTMPAVTSPLVNHPSLSAPVGDTNKSSPKASKANRNANPDANQQILLGVGLAVAIMALLAVVGVTIYQLNQPEKTRPPLKAMEDGKNVIVYDQ